MPRVIDFTWPNKTVSSEVRLPAPVYGSGEMRPEEIQAAPGLGFAPQFSTSGKTASRPVTGDLLDRAHTWLSENTIGPWMWREQWADNGRCIDVSVFVEREPDRAAFCEAYGDVFAYRPPEPRALEDLAVARGVLPELTVMDSPSLWCVEHEGYRLVPDEDLGQRAHWIYFDHPGLEASFLKRFGDEVRAIDQNGSRSYIDLSVEEYGYGRAWSDTPIAWLDENAAIGLPQDSFTQEGRVWSVVVRFDDVADAFRRDWGHVFTAGEDGRTFWTTQDLSPRVRELPAGFVAYLEGRADDYEAPHLPDELVALRTGGGSSAPRT